MAHNFSTAQPSTARGARAYYLHSIIHDWDDMDAGRILGHIRDALIPGYSKLLINDVIIPVHQPAWMARVSLLDAWSQLRAARGKHGVEGE